MRGEQRGQPLDVRLADQGVVVARHARDLDAAGGSIGNTAGTNDLEIDSFRGALCVLTDTGSSLSATCDVGMEADGSIYVTETDKALNNEKVSKALSIFGGESASHRSAIAQERVSLMEEEKDILEQMKQAKTKEEKAALQKQLDELRVVRRELEKLLR